MTNKSTIFFLLLGAVILSSCGAGKKLDNANAQIADLQSQNTQLTSSNNDLKKQVTDLTTQNKTVTDQFNSYKVQCQKNEQGHAVITEGECQRWNNLRDIHRHSG